MWGKVIEHEDGYRAQFARVSALFAAAAPPDDLAVLAKVYAVPVVQPPPGLADLQGSAWGVNGWVSTISVTPRGWRSGLWRSSDGGVTWSLVPSQGGGYAHTTGFGPSTVLSVSPFLDAAGEEREKFEQRYAERSGMTVEQLHAWGRFGEPCDCGEDGCEGFAMGYQHDDALFENERRNR